MNKLIQAYNTKFSPCPCPQNPSQNSSNNITNYQHYQNFISYQHCPNYTMTKKKKKYNNSKMLQSQHYNMINHTMPQIPTRSHNKMTMSHYQTFKQAWNNIFTNKETKQNLTLMSKWEYGEWVLGSWRGLSSSFHSNDGWYFLPWEVRKEGPLEESDILMHSKDGFENGFHQKQVCSKSAQEHKDLKKYWGRWVKEGWVKFFFLILFYFIFLF